MYDERKHTAIGRNLTEQMDAYWQATNYLSVGQVYLLNNPLLKQPLKLEHLSGYDLFGSSPQEWIPRLSDHETEDERCVPLDDPHSNSNYRMAWETLLDAVPCPPEHVHPMRTQLRAPDVAAWDYEKTLRNHFSKDWPRFDLVFLGLGEEGHTASLFPESPALAETKRWMVAVDAPAEPHLRLTLTLPALTHAANAYFLVTGSNKAQALQHILLGSPDPKHYPASGVRLAQGTVIWWLDREAAALVVNRGGDAA